MRARVAELAACASGAAALVFETLFLRLCGYSFGVSQLAASVTLGSFMLGLALGSALAGRHGAGLNRPVAAYCALELLIAAGGLAFVFGFPVLAAAFPALVSLPDAQGLAAAGLGPLTFVLFSVPALAMGMTLPLWVRACRPLYPSYGAALGRLYGANTLGAVCGVLLAELLLIPDLGLRASAWSAAGFNLLAAMLAAALARLPVSPQPRRRPLQWSGPVARLLIAAAVSGFLLLALEVIWFRFLLLYVLDSVAHFAWMLATVLAGIGSGGLLAGWWLARSGAGNAAAAPVCLLAGVVVLGCWLGFQPPAGGDVRYWATEPLTVFVLCLQLMLLPALASGLLYGLLGAALRGHSADDAQATGWLGLVNTLGAAAGAVAAGFLLLPVLGPEWSLRLAVVGYLLLVLLLAVPGVGRPLQVAAVLLAVAVFMLPPTMPRHLDRAAEKYTGRDGSEVVLRREGRYQSIQYLRQQLAGSTVDVRLLTNGYSMSASTADSRRYMQAFAWLPLTLHAQPRDALLISYGLGLTAEALLSDARIQALDIVDLSADILATGRAVMPPPSPLDDPRSTVHIEDGRRFLAGVQRRYDLITGEPPPPRARGIVNLYTREYFARMRARLRDGGMATYWLPVDQLNAASSRAIVAAFCAVFADCSLWSGANYNWILLGSRDARPAPANDYRQLWRDPDSRRLLRDNAFPSPAALFAGFLADARQLAAWSGGQPPLIDDRPGRLQPQLPTAADLQAYFAFRDERAASGRFAASQWVASWLPAPMRAEVQALYPWQPVLNNEIRPHSGAALPVLDAVLQHSQLQVPVLWLLGSDLRRVQIAEASAGDSMELAWHRAASRLAARDPVAATGWLRPYALLLDGFRSQFYLYLLCRTGDAQAARAYGDALQQRGLQAALGCW